MKVMLVSGARRGFPAAGGGRWAAAAPGGSGGVGGVGVTGSGGGGRSLS